ncbi:MULTISPECIES: TspO/MBR family protein [unclassified Sphingomonas]|uniref:TspO/MBR family protein n=1 Tax=unclassified Sphingomonas TaxID=196159 RepID=UPI001F58CEB5|nr:MULTISPECIES: TspO/MBR family protein [unclassified Sphingomonas]
MKVRAPVLHRAWGLPIGLAAIAALGVAVMGATITEVDPWYRGLTQPRWALPEATDGLAWTAVYLVTAWAAVHGWRAVPDQSGAEWMIGLFALSGFFNVTWSLLFFHVHRPDWAVIDAVAWWVSVAAWIYVVWPRSVVAGLLLLPYLGWVTYAGYLTMTIVRLNGPFG